MAEHHFLKNKRKKIEQKQKEINKTLVAKMAEDKFFKKVN